MHNRTLWLATLLTLGCGGDKDGTTPGTTPLTFVTYNAGLAVGFVPGAESRTPMVADALAGVDADFVCLQEVWLPEQVQAIETATASAFTHSYFPAASQSADASCDAGALDSLLSCIDTSCDATCADEVPDCVFASCGVQFLLLPKDCMRCAMASVGDDPAVVADRCVNTPIEYAYGGSFGTGILSKHPLGTVEEHVFTSTSNRRSVLHTTLELEDGPLDVYCTHLTAVFDTIPYPRDSGDWAAEQLAQIQEMETWIAETSGDRKILLGDLNTGPGGDGIVAEAPEGFAALQDAGWDDPYIDLDGRCTFCSTNPLIVGADDNDDRLIDHVLLKGVEATAATRVLDGTITADSCAFDLSVAALSDHYGVSVTVQP